MNNHRPDCPRSWIKNPLIGKEYCSFCNPTLLNQITDLIVFTSSGFHCVSAGCDCHYNWKDSDASRMIYRETATKIIEEIKGPAEIIEQQPIEEKSDPVYIEEEFIYIPNESKFIHMHSGVEFTRENLNLPYEDIYLMLKNAKILPVDDLIDQLREFDENKKMKNTRKVSFIARRTVV